MYEYLHYFIPLLLGWFFAQAPKVTYVMVTKRPKSLFQTIMASGGMPSTHTASVMGLVTHIAFHEHFKGPLFALALVFAVVMMYDAFHVRLACGRAIKRVNLMAEKLYADDGEKPAPLEESNGHTFAEVAVGFFIGVAAGTAFSLIEAHFFG